MEKKELIEKALIHIQESLDEFVGQDLDKSRAVTVALGMWFFKSVDLTVKEEEKNAFVDVVFKLAQEVFEDGEPERTDPEASKDNGSPGTGPEAGPERIP